LVLSWSTSVAISAAIIAAVRLRISLFGFFHGTVAVRMPPQIEAIRQIGLMPTVGILFVNLVVAILLGVLVYIEIGHRILPVFQGSSLPKSGSASGAIRQSLILFNLP
jgi:hypothetical protein